MVGKDRVENRFDLMMIILIEEAAGRQDLPAFGVFLLDKSQFLVLLIGKGILSPMRHKVNIIRIIKCLKRVACPEEQVTLSFSGLELNDNELAPRR
jgi:hypothetical protein